MEELPEGEGQKGQDQEGQREGGEASFLPAAEEEGFLLEGAQERREGPVFFFFPPRFPRLASKGGDRGKAEVEGVEDVDREKGGEGDRGQKGQENVEAAQGEGHVAIAGEFPDEEGREAVKRR